MQLPIIEFQGRKWFHRGNTVETWNPNGIGFCFPAPVKWTRASADFLGVLEVHLMTGEIYGIFGGPEFETMYPIVIQETA